MFFNIIVIIFAPVNPKGLAKQVIEKSVLSGTLLKSGSSLFILELKKMDMKRKIEKEAEKRYLPFYSHRIDLRCKNDRECFTAGATFAASLYEERIKELEEALEECLEDVEQRCEDIGLSPDGYSVVIKARKALNK